MPVLILGLFLSLLSCNQKKKKKKKARAKYNTHVGEHANNLDDMTIGIAYILRTV